MVFRNHGVITCTSTGKKVSVLIIIPSHQNQLQRKHQHLAPKKTRLESEIMHTETAKQAIQCIFDFMIDENGDRPLGCLFINSATEMAPRDKEIEEKVQEAFKQTERLLTDLIRKGQQTGEFRIQISTPQ